MLVTDVEFSVVFVVHILTGINLSFLIYTCWGAIPTWISCKYTFGCTSRFVCTRSSSWYCMIAFHPLGRSATSISKKGLAGARTILCASEEELKGCKPWEVPTSTVLSLEVGEKNHLIWVCVVLLLSLSLLSFHPFWRLTSSTLKTGLAAARIVLCASELKLNLTSTFWKQVFFCPSRL